VKQSLFISRIKSKSETCFGGNIILFKVKTCGGRNTTVILDDEELVCEGVTWNNLAQDRTHFRNLVNMLINLLVPVRVGNYLSQFSGYQLHKKRSAE
jgi:hypothetical protein